MRIEKRIMCRALLERRDQGWVHIADSPTRSEVWTVSRALLRGYRKVPGVMSELIRVWAETEQDLEVEIADAILEAEEKRVACAEEKVE